MSVTTRAKLTSCATLLAAGILYTPAQAQAPSSARRDRRFGARPSHREARRLGLGAAAAAAAAEAGQLRHPQHALGHDVDHARNRRGAPVDLRRAEAHRARGCRSASTRYQIPAKGAHHPGQSSSERDGGPAGQDARAASTSAATTTRSTSAVGGSRPAGRPGGRAGRQGQGQPGAAAPAGRAEDGQTAGARDPGARRARAEAPGEPADPQQRPGQDYNVDAPGANDDGSGTVLSMELARVFAESGIEFDATLVFMTRRRRGAGPGRRRRARQEGARREDPDPGLVQQRHRRQLARRRRQRRRRHDPPLLGRAGGFAVARAGAVRRSASAAAYVPSHRVRLMARRDRFSRGGDHSALNAAGVRRDRLPGVARELREAARRRRHHRRRGLPLPGAERAGECRRHGDAGAGAAAAGRRQRRAAQPTIDRRAVRLRRAPALGGVARRGRLPDLLARTRGRPTGSTS